MNLSQLEYLEVACRTGKLTDVAKTLRVTQQAVSSAISSLERELGVRLLERGHDGVRPTVACAELLPDVRTAMGAVTHIRSRAAELRGDLAGTVTFAYATCTVRSVGPHPNRDDLDRFCMSHPDVTLRTFEAASDACLALLTRGTADIALVAGEPDAHGFTGRFLCTRELVLCVTADHPFAERDGSLSFADLRDVPQLLPPDLNYSLRLTDSACRRWGFEPTYLEMPQTAGSQVELVASGYAVAFVPVDFEEARESDEVRLVHMRSEEACYIPLWLASSVAHEPSAAMRAFADYFAGLFDAAD